MIEGTKERPIAGRVFAHGKYFMCCSPRQSAVQIAAEIERSKPSFGMVSLLVTYQKEIGQPLSNFQEFFVSHLATKM